MQNRLAVESIHAVLGVGPVDTTGAGQDTAWMKASKSRKIRFFIATGAWAGGNAAVTLEQATDVAGAGAKALAMAKYFTNTKADDTMSEVAVVANTFNVGVANKLYIIEVLANDLDINNGFDYIRCRTATPGANADLIAILAEAYDLNFECKPADQELILT